MKRTPAKGLGDFFSTLGKQLKRNRRDIGGEFKGVKQKDKPGGFGSLTDKDKDGMSDFIQAPKKAPKGKETVSTKTNSTPKSKSTKSTKPDWSKAPKVGTTARTDWYKKFNLALDDTTPGYKEKSEKSLSASGKSIHSTTKAPNPGEEEKEFDPKNPFPKKSPYKKGISKNYTRKPKGSRGFKMKK